MNLGARLRARGKGGGNVSSEAIVSLSSLRKNNATVNIQLSNTSGVDARILGVFLALVFFYFLNQDS